jgi:hypothetical protein
MENKVLWVQNAGTSDVSLSDLGVKVPAGKTINVYKTNPYLTEAMVKQSLESGALFKRLSAKILKIVNKAVSTKSPILDKINTSKGSVSARKTKTSVIIGVDDPEDSIEAEFDFADYGVSDAVTHKKVDNAVVVDVKQDDLAEQAKLAKQPKELLDIMKKNAVDPMGPLAPAESMKNYQIIVKPQTKVTVEQPKANFMDPKIEHKAEVEQTEPLTKKTHNGAVVIGEDVEPTRSLRAVVNGTQDIGVVLDDDQAGADKVIKDGSEEGMRVATKNAEGVIVMTIKDDAAPGIRKAKPNKKT